MTLTYKNDNRFELVQFLVHSWIWLFPIQPDLDKVLELGLYQNLAESCGTPDQM